VLSGELSDVSAVSQRGRLHEIRARERFLDERLQIMRDIGDLFSIDRGR